MGKSKPSAKTEVELVVPQPTLTTTPLQGTDSSELPFKEWSDAEVNAEKWTADTKGKAKVPGEEQNPFFEDPQVVHLPNSIVVHEWKRPAQIYPEAEFIIFEEKPIYPDLISGSKHLLHSEFVRSFISSINILMYLGNTGQIPSIEFTTPTYVPYTLEEPWRPWHHIYSNCKIGKGKEHAPVVNAIGKYVVRLFWLGAWRKVYVDDLIPVDMIDHVLLPSLELTKEEQEKLTPAVEQLTPTPASAKKPVVNIKVIEIWPFLLSKALMKLASLSWYDERELLDFDIVQCLTGWVPQNINTKDLSLDDIWDICRGYTDQFCWPDDKSEAGGKGAKGGKDKGKKGGPLLDEDSGANAFHLLARCKDLRSFAEDEVLDISPCWSHYFLIDQSRDIPLIKPTLTVDLAFWKRFRWLDWAVEKGLISVEENMDQIRCFKLVSPFKKIYEHVFYRQPSKIALEIEQAVQVVEDDKGKKGKGKEKEDKSAKASKASSKASSKGSGKKKKIDVNLIPNPSIWIYYDELMLQVNSITIYFIPSKFKAKIKITDLAPTGKAQAPKKKGDPSAEWKFLINPTTLRESRNEPIYAFSDSVDYKLLVINLVQTGYTPIFDKSPDKEEPVNTGITECEFCVASLVKRIKRNITKSELKTFITVTPDEPEIIDHDRPRAHLVLEKCNWQTERLGEMITSITTFNGKTAVVDLCPGRYVFRLWIKSDTSYVAYVLSDTSVVCGAQEEILFSLSQESQLLINMCIDVASNFGKLVQAFGLPEFGMQLKSFYSSYKPACHITKAECNILHDTFYNMLYELTEENLTPVELRALKILLLRWQLPRYVRGQVEPLDLCNCYVEDEEFEYVKIMERYVVKIQYFFMGIYERSMMRHHKEEHKNYYKTFESLKKIYTTLLSADRRLKILPSFFRSFLDHPDLSEISKKYKLKADLENVICLQEVEDIVTLPENDWAFICRQQFFIISPEPVLLKINLFCDVSRYLVRVIDNDTKRELKRYTNNVTVNTYESNINGYTVLCYGWSTTATDLLYKLSFAIKKELNENQLLVPSMTTKVDLISGNYIPNVNNYICRYLVRVSSENILLTTRFWTCYEDVMVNLRLLDDYGVLLQEVTGKKNIVLPAIVLEYKEKESTKIASELSFKLKKLSTASLKSGSKKSQRGSLKSNRSKRSSKRSSGRSSGRSSKDYSTSLSEIEEIPEDTDTIFLIEAIVVENTWPLKVEEWRGVSGLKAEMLVGPLLKQLSSGEGTMSKKSSETLKKTLSRSNLEYTKSESLLVETPNWVLQIICNSTDPVQFERDVRREEEIKNMKMKWYEPDPMRYDISLDLRQEYLTNNLIANENLPDDLTGLRNLDPNYFAAEILPPYDRLLSDFMGRPKVVKVESDEEVVVRESATTSSEALSELSKPSSGQGISEIDNNSYRSEEGEMVYENKRHTSLADESTGEEVEDQSGHVTAIEAPEDKRKLKTAEDFEKDLQEEQCQLQKFQALHESMIEGFDMFIAQQQTKFVDLDAWFTECRNDSVIMMNYALSLKEDYIQQVLDELTKAKAAQEGSKGGGDDKGGKDKKKK